jgi:hypothetical protein
MLEIGKAEIENQKTMYYLQHKDRQRVL